MRELNKYITQTHQTAEIPNRPSQPQALYKPPPPPPTQNKQGEFDRDASLESIGILPSQHPSPPTQNPTSP